MAYAEEPLPKVVVQLLWEVHGLGGHWTKMRDLISQFQLLVTSLESAHSVLHPTFCYFASVASLPEKQFSGLLVH